MSINIYEISDDYQDKLTDMVLKEFKDTVEEVLVTEEDLYKYSEEEAARAVEAYEHRYEV